MTSRQIVTESVAKVLIVNDKKEVLVLTLGKHLKYPEKSFLPDLPGGIVDPGEPEQLAAIRETKEETGVDLDEKGIRLAYAQTTYSMEESKSISKLLYIARINHDPEITLSWEHSDFKWVPVNKLDTIEFRPFLKEAAAYLLDHDLLG